MKSMNRTLGIVVGCAVLFATSFALAQDWPQWRGPNRDGKATGFKAPATWPKELKQQWQVTVGQGDGGPVVVGDKVFIFGRQGGDEVLACLNITDGKEVWKDKYPVAAIQGPDAREHSGPRSTPAVADGKIVTQGVTGVLSCYDLAGKMAWRKEEFTKSFPRFHVASSPIIVDGMCVAQLGGGNDGATIAFDLGSGTEKWKWTGEGPGYASPVLMTIDGTQVLITQTDRSVVAINAADGKGMWQVAFAPQGMGYNASTPAVNGTTLIYAGQGRGVKAVQFSKDGEKLAAKDLWTNTDNSPQFNSLVLKDGLLYGIAQNGRFFCINAQDGKTAWTGGGPAGGGGRGPMGAAGMSGQPILAAGGMGGGRGGRGGGMGGGAGYGSIIDAGAVLMALTPASDLIIFQPGDKQYTEVAKIKVASTPVYAYPALCGNRLLVKDREMLTMWVIE